VRVERIKRGVLKELFLYPVYSEDFNSVLTLSPGEVREVELYIDSFDDYLVYSKGRLEIYLRPDTYRYLPDFFVFLKLKGGLVFGSITPTGYYSREGFVRVRFPLWEKAYRLFYWLEKAFLSPVYRYLEMELKYPAIIDEKAYFEWWGLREALTRRDYWKKKLENLEDFVHEVVATVI